MLDELRLYFWKVRQVPEKNFSLNSVVRNYLPWKRTMKTGKSPLKDGLPWMTFDAIRFLRKNIRKDMNVFEYGMGGSTVFFSGLAGKVVSVEHDMEWFEITRKFIEDKNIQNVNSFLHTPQQITGSEVNNPSNPELYTTADMKWKSCSFENYVKAIDAYPPGHFDLIVIDGRSRPSCIKHATSALKAGGLLLVDNADRTHYQRAIEEYLTGNFSDEVSYFGPTAFAADFTQTLIRRKK